jgi:hypothetical protein
VPEDTEHDASPHTSYLTERIARTPIRPFPVSISERTSAAEPRLFLRMRIGRLAASSLIEFRVVKHTMFQGHTSISAVSFSMAAWCVVLGACDGNHTVSPDPVAKAEVHTEPTLQTQTLQVAEHQVRSAGVRVEAVVRQFASETPPSEGVRIGSDFSGHFREGVLGDERTVQSYRELAGMMRALLGKEALGSLGCKTKVPQVIQTQNGVRALFKVHCAADAKESKRCATRVTGWLDFIPMKAAWILTHSAIHTADKTCAEKTYFEDLTMEVGLSHRGLPFHAQGKEATHWQGAASGDVDGDGRWDIFVPGRKRNHLYLNTAASGFVEVAEAWGVDQPPGGTGVVFFDYDNDGDQDLFVGFPGAHPTNAPGGIRAFRNERKKRFLDRSEPLGFIQHHAAYPLVVLDANNDGYLDLYVGGYGHLLTTPNNSWVNATNGAADALYLNQGGRSFRRTDAINGNGFTYAAGAVDIDHDGQQDIYAGHDFGPNALYRNVNGSFTNTAKDRGVQAPGNAMGVTFADFDSDGGLDLIVTHMSSTAGDRILRHVQDELPAEHLVSLRPFASGNAILLRRGETFVPLPTGSVGIESGWAWGPAVADFDLDGDLDLYVVNGYITGESAHDT